MDRVEQITKDTLIIERYAKIFEFEDMEKVFKAILAFARKVELEPEVYLNDKKWNAFYVQLQATKAIKMV